MDAESHLGLRHYSRTDLEAVRNSGAMLHIKVLGLASVAQDVTAELARAAIASVMVLGVLHAGAEVKAAVADRLHVLIARRPRAIAVPNGDACARVPSKGSSKYAKAPI